MLNGLKKINGARAGLFAAGVLFGTAGIRILSSKDAKKVYTNVTAAVLRGKECVMDIAEKIQENCGDIYAKAKEINEDRAAEQIIEDAKAEAAKEEEAATETAQA